jgi:hypothetical protein
MENILIPEEAIIIFDVGEVPDQPIKMLIKEAGYAIVNIVKERNEDLKKIIKGRISLSCTNSDIWEFGTAFGAIHTLRKTFEILWALSYGYSVFLSEVVDKERIRLGEVNLVDPNTTEGKGLSIIKWAMDEFEIGQTTPLLLPTNLPCPTTDFEKGSNEDIARRVFYVVFTFFIHHELAHIVLDTSDELSCDLHAAEWIMKEVPDKANETYRLFGIAVAASILAAIDVRKTKKDSTHPCGFKRMDLILKKYAPYLDHQIWDIVSIILTLHMSFLGIPSEKITSIEVSVAGEAINHYLKLIQEHQAS